MDGGILHEIFSIGNNLRGGSIQLRYYGHLGANATLNFLTFDDGATSATIDISHDLVLTDNTWYHIAAVRDGNDYLFFVDGTQLGSTVTNSATTYYYEAHTHTYLLINAREYSITQPLGDVDFGRDIIPGGFAVYDDIRFTIGTARYTSNYTAPTTAFATDSPSVAYFNEKSSTGHAVTLVDSAGQTTGGSGGKYGEGYAFDGLGDYLTIPGHADWAVASGDFTFETWFKAGDTQNTFPIFSPGNGG